MLNSDLDYIWSQSTAAAAMKLKVDNLVLSIKCGEWNKVFCTIQSTYRRVFARRDIICVWVEREIVRIMINCGNVN